MSHDPRFKIRSGTLTFASRTGRNVVRLTCLETVSAHCISDCFCAMLLQGFKQMAALCEEESMRHLQGSNQDTMRLHMASKIFDHKSISNLVEATRDVAEKRSKKIDGSSSYPSDPVAITRVS